MKACNTPVTFKKNGCISLRMNVLCGILTCRTPSHSPQIHSKLKHQKLHNTEVMKTSSLAAF